MPERAGHSEHARDPTDYYATTPELARLICEAVKRDFGAENPALILEPGCGAGSFMGAIREAWPNAAVLHGIEVRAELARMAAERGFDVERGDVLTAKLGEYDLILGNPPFRYADEFIPVLLASLKRGGILALILRLNYLAGQERFGALWSRHPPALIYALPARPGFTPDGKTDATDYCVAVWVDGHAGQSAFAWLDNRAVRNKWDGSDYPTPRANENEHQGVLA